MAVSLVKLREENVGELKRLNAVLFPINYRDRDYSNALAAADFSKLAFLEGACVGSISCRIERVVGGRRLYIMTLGVLSPYRRMGIGSKLLKSALDRCQEDLEFLEIYLHVHIDNEEALQFYKRFDFQIVELIRNYYKRIKPPDCYVLSKKMKSEKEIENETDK